MTRGRDSFSRPSSAGCEGFDSSGKVNPSGRLTPSLPSSLFSREPASVDDSSETNDLPSMTTCAGRDDLFPAGVPASHEANRHEQRCRHGESGEKFPVHRSTPVRRIPCTVRRTVEPDGVSFPQQSTVPSASLRIAWDGRSRNAPTGSFPRETLTEAIVLPARPRNGGTSPIRGSLWASMRATRSPGWIDLENRGSIPARRLPARSICACETLSAEEESDSSR